MSTFWDIPWAAARADMVATSRAADDETPFPSGTAEDTCNLFDRVELHQKCPLYSSKSMRGKAEVCLFCLAQFSFYDQFGMRVNWDKAKMRIVLGRGEKATRTSAFHFTEAQLCIHVESNDLQEYWCRLEIEHLFPVLKQEEFLQHMLPTYKNTVTIRIKANSLSTLLRHHGKERRPMHFILFTVENLLCHWEIQQGKAIFTS